MAKLDREERGELYLLCFGGALAHARHYLGWTQTGRVETRVGEHLGRGKKGSPLVAAAIAAGLKPELVRTIEGSRNDERRLKNRKNLRRLCPRCAPEEAEEQNEGARRRRENRRRREANAKKWAGS